MVWAKEQEIQYLRKFIAYLIYKENNNRYNSKVITTLCKTVADISRQPLSENKPIIGEKVTTHESGIHTSAILKNRASYQFINPSDFGQLDKGFCFGKHSWQSLDTSFF